jgi:hypothetical protein
MSSDRAQSLPPPRVVSDSVTTPYRLVMGLAAIRPEESWLEIDSELSAHLQTKHALLAERRNDVFVEVEESRPAQREVLEIVVGELLERHAAHYTLRDERWLSVRPAGREIDLQDESAPPLEIAARCVQEDLVVMEERAAGWCLTAAAVCFPTRWQLRPQLGRPMTAIHERVPGYRAELDHSANRFFDGMKSGAVFRRGNWSLMDDPALFQPTCKYREGHLERLTAENAGDEIWLRVEHQTLQRMPASGAILFGVRIHRSQLAAVAQEPDTARALLGAISTMPAEMQRYKSLELVRGATVDYLRARLCAPEGSA